MHCYLSILIPSSLTSESKDQRIKTYKVGQIARSASMFRVDKIIIYKDPEYDDSKFIDLVLRYAETPQYMRKQLFPLSDELKYVGVIPPLRTPHHPLQAPKIGEFREGIVTKVGLGENAWVDIGIKSPVPLCADKIVNMGERVTVKIFSRRPLKVKLASKEQIPIYWGYQTQVSGTLGKVLKEQSRVIATSKCGEVLGVKMLSGLGEAMQGEVSIAFGSPNRGLDSILEEEGLLLSNLSDYIINTIPHQGTNTIRTEEAISATLAMLNIIRKEVKCQTDTVRGEGL